MEKKETGKPLGDPANRGKGKADPHTAGEEGGTGFLGDQRQEGSGRTDREKGDPPLDSTIERQDVDGDRDEKKPGPDALAGFSWDGPRFNMGTRKREPLIVW